MNKYLDNKESYELPYEEFIKTKRSSQKQNPLEYMSLELEQIGGLNYKLTLLEMNFNIEKLEKLWYKYTYPYPGLVIGHLSDLYTFLEKLTLERYEELKTQSDWELEYEPLDYPQFEHFLLMNNLEGFDLYEFRRLFNETHTQAYKYEVGFTWLTGLSDDNFNLSSKANLDD